MRSPAETAGSENRWDELVPRSQTERLNGAARHMRPHLAGRISIVVAKPRAPTAEAAKGPKAEAAKRKVGAAPKLPPGQKPHCGICGHWSVATEYGVDDKSGYCDRWEKLTDRDYVCDEFVSKEKFKEMQKELADQHEDYMDEDTG